MPGVVRQNVDSHKGHASGSPSPFHKTNYTSPAQGKVYAEGNLVVVDGGKTGCGDPTAAVSGKVFGPGTKGVHRKGDATGGHGSFAANAAATGSSKVIAG
jgi:hypothetical protein